MPRYQVELFAVHEFVYGHMEVEADTPEEARNKALELAEADDANFCWFEYLPHGYPHQWQVNDDQPVELAEDETE